MLALTRTSLHVNRMQAATFLSASVGAAALFSKRRQMRTAPPVAKRVPHVVKVGAVEGENRGGNPMSPAVEVVDDLFWLRDDDRKSEDVIAHLNAENDYTQIKTAGLQVDDLYKELLSRVKETDADVPYLHGGYLYYTRTEAGKSYTIHCRVRAPAAAAGHHPDAGLTSAALTETHVPHAEKAPAAGHGAAAGGNDAAGPRPGEEVLLDENELASGHPMLDVASVSPSPDHRLVAYAADFSGYETYTIKIKRVGGGSGSGSGAGEHVEDELEGTNG